MKQPEMLPYTEIAREKSVLFQFFYELEMKKDDFF